MSALPRAHTGCYCVIPCVWVVVVVIIITKTAGLLLVGCAIKVGDGLFAASDVTLNGEASVVEDAESILLLELGHALRNVTNTVLRAAFSWHACEVYCAGAKAIWLSLAEVLNTCRCKLCIREIAFL